MFSSTVDEAREQVDYRSIKFTRGEETAAALFARIGLGTPRNFT
jgi:hypothetical protein